MLDWGTYPREAGPPGPRLSSPGEWERNAVIANRVGVNMLQFCSVSNSLSHTTLSVKWEVYFSKRLCRSSLLCRCYDSACMHMCLYSWSWLYNIMLWKKNVSTFTEAGLYGRIAVKKSLLRKLNNVKRFQWAKAYKDWTKEQLNKVLWTDESKFEIFGLNKRFYV